MILTTLIIKKQCNINIPYYPFLMNYHMHYIFQQCVNDVTLFWDSVNITR